MKVYEVYVLNKTDAKVEHQMLFTHESAALNHADYLIDGLLENGYCLEECYDGETRYFDGEDFKVFTKNKDTVNEKIVEVFFDWHIVFEN